MTRFLTTDIPQQIQTIEQLVVWCAEILQNQFPNVTCVETLDQDGNDIKVRRVEGNKFFYTAPQVPTWRYLTRIEVDLNADHQVYGRIWDHAVSLGDTPIPQGMKRVS